MGDSPLGLTKDREAEQVSTAPKKQKRPMRSLSEEEKWVVGGLAVMVPAAGLRYRDEIESWVADNKVWLIGLIVLFFGSCVVAMVRAARRKRPRDEKQPIAQPTAVFGSEGLASPSLDPVPALGEPVPADEAPALAAALKLDYSGGKPRTVRRGPVELGEEWVIELPPAGVYGDVATKAPRIASWLGVPDDQFTMRPGSSSREVVLLVLDERNHGLLTVGESAKQAFLRMYYLEKACEIQVTAQAGGQLIIPSEQVCEYTAQQLTGEGEASSDIEDDIAYDLAWGALLRLVERIAPDYKE